MPPATFHVVCDAAYFVGLVAFLNSVRLAGHDEPVVVDDLGLEAWQRERLGGHAAVVRRPPREDAVMGKAAIDVAGDRSVTVVADCDVIVLRSLTPLLEVAAGGDVVAFADNQVDRRWFAAEWGRALGRADLPARPYVNAGLVAYPAGSASPVIDAQRRVQAAIPPGGGRDRSHPFFLADQDSLNAALAAIVPQERVTVLPYRLAPFPPFDGLRRGDGLRCRYGDGAEPFLLHHVARKPWQGSTRPNLYTSLLPRLLHGPDVAVRLAPAELPRRFAGGSLERIEAAAAAALKVVGARRTEPGP